MDARVWLLGDVPSGLGYEYDLDYYFRDFTWLNYSERRSGVDNPDGYNRGIKHTERSLTLHRQIGQQFAVRENRAERGGAVRTEPKVPIPLGDLDRRGTA